MSERMTPMPFSKLMDWLFCERDAHGAVFGVQKPFMKRDEKMLPLFRETIETPFGPAAGPNTQLAENIIAAYYVGARFFELKTVQKMDVQIRKLHILILPEEGTRMIPNRGTHLIAQARLDGAADAAILKSYPVIPQILYGGYSGKQRIASS